MPDSYTSQRQAGAADASTVVITTDMVEAGAQELLESFRLGGDVHALVEQIFIAMAHASPQLGQLMIQDTGVPVPRLGGA